jgi:aminodeoxyfutalosine synthase
MEKALTYLLEEASQSPMKTIAEKVFDGSRISNEEGLWLYRHADLGKLGILANHVREEKNQDHTFFNRNFHFEPTNICIYNCQFCSYRRSQNDPDAWEYSLEDLEEKIRDYQGQPVTEIHIVGGVHPHRDLHYYGRMLQLVKELRPDIHIKAFTAIELDYMIRKAGLGIKEGLIRLKEYGLDSIPGGGAEIFNETVRRRICHQKSDANLWLEIHRTAHELGIPSNATMLYGHIETFEDRIDHLDRLRRLQDETGGFSVFIPLKFKRENNRLYDIGEVSHLEDLRNYAVSRIFLDNFPHIKAYWPMIGKDLAQISLSFGVDDIDGTIDDSTRIYTMAGSDEQNPTLSTEELVQIIHDARRIPVERNTLYQTIKVYDR